MVWGIRNYGLSELLRRPAVRVHHWFVFLIRDHFWQLPDNKATIRGNTCKSVPVDGHIGHGGGGSKHPGKLKQGTITTRTRNDADTTFRGKRVRTTILLMSS